MNLVPTFPTPAISRKSDCILKKDTENKAEPKNANNPTNITTYLSRTCESDDTDFCLNRFRYFLLWLTTQ